MSPNNYKKTEMSVSFLHKIPPRVYTKDQRICGKKSKQTRGVSVK